MGAGSLNRVTLIGNLGQDPEFKSSTYSEFCTISVATTDRWTDKRTNTPTERTEWHRVVIFSEPLVKVIRQYVRKGDKVMVEGRLQTRQWKTEAGETRYSTEVVLSGYDGRLIMLGGRSDAGGRAAQSEPASTGKAIPDQPLDIGDQEKWDLDDTPF